MTSCSSLQNRDFDDDDDDLNVDDGPGKHSLTVIFSLIGDTVICINAAKEKKMGYSLYGLCLILYGQLYGALIFSV